ncbi:MAG: ABC transporter ATP-binding protein, partial [Mycobacterium sp.]
MLTLLRAQWISMVVSMFLLGGAAALILLQPLLAGRLVDRATAGSPSLAFGVALLTMLFLQLALEGIGHFRLDRTGERIVLRLRAEFTNHVVRLPIGVLDVGRTGELLARGTSDASLLRDMPRAVGDIAFGIMTLLGAGIFMLSIDAVTVGVVVAVMAAAFIAGNPFLSRIQRASLNRQAALGDYTAGLDRALGAARTIKLYGAEAREANSIGLSARSAYQAGVRVASSSAINTLLVRSGVSGSFLAIMVIDGRRVAHGGLSIGEFVSLFAFAMYAVFPVTAAFAALANLRISAGAYQHLTAILRELPEADRPALPVSKPPSDSVDETQHTSALIEFDHVSFGYGDNRVLDDVSFELARNQITALIGPSGAGKSTILALLCRFHSPDAGTIRWDGHDLRSIELSDLRGRLGLLEQDAPVLDGTIRDNLLIANPDATDTELWQVLEQANVAAEIARLPQQLDSPVSERGRSLSGGQRQ